MLWIRPEKLQMPFRVTVNFPIIAERSIDFFDLGRLYHDHRGHVWDGQPYTVSSMTNSS
jgi:hypothetical protein